MKKIYKFGNFLFIIFVSLIAVIVLVSVLPVPGKWQIKIVQSGSMEPAIKTGSLVIIKPSDSYKIGDVITFGKDTKKEVPTTHRIVADRAVSGVMLYTTKGDANEDNDTKEVREDEIIGKNIISIPYFGYVIDFARQPFGFIILIGLPAIYIVYEEIRKIIKEVRKMRIKKIEENNSDENV